MNSFRKRASYLVAAFVLLLSGCGIGRYNNQLTAMKWPEKRRTTIQLQGSTSGRRLFLGSTKNISYFKLTMPLQLLKLGVYPSVCLNLAGVSRTHWYRYKL